MNWIYTILFSLTVQFIFAQNVRIEKDPDSGFFVYQEVIPLENITIHDGFERAIYWISKNYKFLNEVIKVESEDKKEIIFDSFFNTTWMMETGEISHKLILEFKEGRMRITASHFSYFTPDSGNQPFEGMILFKKTLIQHSERKLENLLRLLVDEISGVAKAEDDW